MKNYSISMLVARAYAEFTRKITLNYSNYRIWVYNCYSILFIIMYLCFLLMAFIVQDQFMKNCYTLLFVMPMIFRILPYRFKNSKTIHLIITLLVSLSVALQISYYRTMLPSVFFIPYALAMSLLYDFYKDKWMLLLNIALMLVTLLLSSSIEIFRSIPTVTYLNFYNVVSILAYFIFAVFVLLVNLLVVKLKTDEIHALSVKADTSNQLENLLFEDESVPNNYFTAGYLETVKEKYPTFYTTLTGQVPTLAKSELIILTLIKLNLNTAQIARHTNSSIRSIQSVKYRIRKKLAIPQDSNLKEFVDSLG